jgi:hypothetical protein
MSEGYTTSEGKLFGRNYLLQITNPGAPASQDNTLDITGLDISFNIVLSKKKEPNPGEFRIYNIRDSTSRIEHVVRAGKLLTLSVGYNALLKTSAGIEEGWRTSPEKYVPEGFVDWMKTGVIFKGDIRSVDFLHENADWCTKVECGEGSKKYYTDYVTISKAGGTTKKDVLKAIILEAGWATDDRISRILNLPGFEKLDAKYNQGYSYFGRASKALTDLLSRDGYSWSFQGDELTILPKKGYVLEELLLVTDTSGLIGSPESTSAQKIGGLLTPKGATPKGPKKLKKQSNLVKFKSLILPTLRPGRKVQLESIHYERCTVVLNKVTIDGNTWGDDWYCVCEGQII